MIKKIALIFLIALAVFPAFAQEKSVRTFKVRVSAEQANIRERPDIGSPVLKQIPETTVLEAEGKEGEWYLVRYLRENGTSGRGYIHESLVVEIEPAPVAKPKKPVVTDKPKDRREPPPIEIIPSRGKNPPPAAGTAASKTFGFSLLAGGNYAMVGDLNAGARGLAGLYGEILDVEGTGKIKGLHATYILGAEISYSLTPKFELVLGLDYLSGKKFSRMQFATGGDPEIVGTRPEIQALPFKAGISYKLFPFLYVKANIQYYFAKCTYLYRYEQGTYWQEWQGNARAGGLGAGLAVGGEWEFYPGVFLLGEAQFRFAKIGGFKGKTLSVNSYGESYTEDGTLYIFEKQGPGTARYPLVFIRGDVPAETGVYDPREARVDFSGMSLRTGIRVRF